MESGDMQFPFLLWVSSSCRRQPVLLVWLPKGSLGLAWLPVHTDGVSSCSPGRCSAPGGSFRALQSLCPRTLPASAWIQLVSYRTLSKVSSQAHAKKGEGGLCWQLGISQNLAYTHRNFQRRHRKHMVLHAWKTPSPSSPTRTSRTY